MQNVYNKVIDKLEVLDQFDLEDYIPVETSPADFEILYPSGLCFRWRGLNVPVVNARTDPDGDLYFVNWFYDQIM